MSDGSSQALVTCPECGYAKEIGRKCPNPACFVGFGDYSRRVQAWTAARKAAGDAAANKWGFNARQQAIDRFERDNPRPVQP